VLTNILSEAGGLPTRNFSLGTFEKADDIGGERQAETIKARGGHEHHGCHTGCTIQCSRYWMDKDGHYKTKGPEYETAWSMGADCGIGDLDEIAELDRACGDLGLDTIEMGATLAVYMDSGKIEFGDAKGALDALMSGGQRRRARPSALGRRGLPPARRSASPTSRGEEPGDARIRPASVMGIGVTYATSPQGADHTAGYTITANILSVGGTVDPLKPEGQAELSKNLQIATAMLDSAGLCIFVAFAVLDIPDAFTAIHDMLERAHRRRVGPRCADAARQGDARLRAALQREGRLHGCRRPAARILQDRAAASAQHRVPGHRRGLRQRVRLRAGDRRADGYLVGPAGRGAVLPHPSCSLL
jgi:aldehyde:ferredoxin oxidoreductase